MADDDEVDVLGDFSLDSLFPKEDSRLHCYDASVLGSQSSDLLHDYMAPQWLLDTSQSWYSTDDKSRGTSDRLLPEERQNTFGFNALTGVESPTKNVPGTSRWEDQELGWTDREKSLLEKGIEMFGRSWNKISQLIGTKTASQVKSFVKWERSNRSEERIVIEENVSSNYDQQTGEVFSFSEIIDDIQIPASIEEVIAVVSTASPTIPISLSRLGDNRDRRKDSGKNQGWNGKQAQHKGSSSKKQELQRDLEERKKRDKKRRIVGNVLVEERIRSPIDKQESNALKKRELKTKGSSNKQGKSFIKGNNLKPSFGECKDPPRLPENLSCGEEVIRIAREGSESDGSVIEVGDDEPVLMNIKCEPKENDKCLNTTASHMNLTSAYILHGLTTTVENFTSSIEVKQQKEEKEMDIKDGKLSGLQEDTTNFKQSNLNLTSAMKDRKDKSSFHQDIMDNIAAIVPPLEEFYPDLQTISEQEKMIHTEFFEGRSTKTPKRYMKIRNHILECWYNSRPQYVTKTSVRTGLRNCGDVNCIGRIHAYLEQVGAINFGCEQARYLRPQVYPSQVTNSPVEGDEQVDLFRGPTREEISARHQARIEAMRPRKRKGMDLTSSLEEVDGGYTIIHNGNGDGVEDSDGIVFVKASQSSRKNNQCTRAGNDQSKLKLLRCHQYSQDHPAPIALELSLDALLVVDLHAHLMQSEVAGLLGGYLKKKHDISSNEKGQNILRICRAIPCRSSSSNVGCDICPVSQTEALEVLEAEGLELVGWYHSHPTFPPLPSIQDIETQMHVQEWFTRSSGSPFLGLILSPHTTLKDSLASTFRCLLVEINQETKQQVPFELAINIVSLEAAEPCLSYLNNVISVINTESSSYEADLDSPLKSVFMESIALRKKIIESARTLMEASNGDIKYYVQVAIINGLEKLLTRLSNYSTNNVDDGEHH